MSLREDVARSIAISQVGWIGTRDAVTEYTEACLRFDWPAAEEARARAADLFDAYLVHLGAAAKRLQSEGDRPCAV